VLKVDGTGVGDGVGVQVVQSNSSKISVPPDTNPCPSE